MIKKSFTTAVFVFLASFGLLHSQSLAKFDLRSQAHIKTLNALGGTNENIHLVVKGDLKKIEALTKSMGGTYKYGYNGIASVTIPEQRMEEFSSSMAVKKIHHPYTRGTALMDTARIRNNIDSVIAGYAPLQTGVTGKGVLIGIIDGGIYWQHPDFKHSDGTTRIRYIWDQSVTGGSNKPLPYNYGNEWSWNDINTGNCTEVEPFYPSQCNDNGHGTCVAGIAAGNGASVAGNPHLAGVYTGVAPESELIVVNLGGICSNNFDVQIADAVDYIFKKADALGMPCVINISEGNYAGSHDGIDLTTQLIENLLDQRNGRCVVAAAGNEGNVPFHIGYTIPSDSAYTFFKYNPLGYAYFDFWSDSIDITNGYFAVGCNDTFGNDLGRTAYFNVLADFAPPADSTIFMVRNLYAANNALLGQVNIAVTLDQGRYNVEFYILPSSTVNWWRLQTSGSGKLDIWASAALTGSSDIIDAINSVPIQYTNYRHPDFQKTMVSSFQNSSKVITVGNYSNRSSYLNIDSTLVDLTVAGPSGNLPEVVGKRFVTSSFGPTRDNRLKPDIMATGSTILCTGDANNISVLSAAPNNRLKIALGGKHIRNGGTSMSAPIVAGIAALYFQKRPTATYDEIKKALIWTATKDSFTGNTANNEYGNGKVNAFQALTNDGIIYGAQDTACINYNALANIDTNGCVAKIYGCTIPDALNYDSTANVDNNVTCAFATSIYNPTGQNIVMLVMPNPFSGQTTFRVEGINFEKGEIRIFDQLGNDVDGFNVSQNNKDYLYQNQKLAKGFYTYVLSADGKNMKNGKLVIQ